MVSLVLISCCAADAHRIITPGLPNTEKEWQGADCLDGRIEATE